MLYKIPTKSKSKQLCYQENEKKKKLFVFYGFYLDMCFSQIDTFFIFYLKKKIEMWYYRLFGIEDRLLSTKECNVDEIVVDLKSTIF